MNFCHHKQQSKKVDKKITILGHDKLFFCFACPRALIFLSRVCFFSKIAALADFSPLYTSHKKYIYIIPLETYINMSYVMDKQNVKNFIAYNTCPVQERKQKCYSSTLAPSYFFIDYFLFFVLCTPLTKSLVQYNVFTSQRKLIITQANLYIFVYFMDKNLLKVSKILFIWPFF